MPIPTHAYFGFPKCGTKTISGILRLHPNIDNSKWDETHFFCDAEIFKNGWSFNENRNWLGYTGKSVRIEHDIRGVWSKDAIVRLKSVAPEAKVLLSVRDPVARAISNYWYIVRLFSEFRAPAEALAPVSSNDPFHDKTSYLWLSRDYVTQGRYEIYITELLKHMPVSDMHVINLQKVGLVNSEEVKRMFDFLGLDNMEIPTEDRSRQIRNNVGGPATLRRCVRSVDGGDIGGIVWMDNEETTAQNIGGTAAVFDPAPETMRAAMSLNDHLKATDWNRIKDDLRAYYAPTYDFLEREFGISFSSSRP